MVHIHILKIILQRKRCLNLSPTLFIFNSPKKIIFTFCLKRRLFIFSKNCYIPALATCGSLSLYVCLSVFWFVFLSVCLLSVAVLRKVCPCFRHILKIYSCIIVPWMTKPYLADLYRGMIPCNYSLQK